MAYTEFRKSYGDFEIVIAPVDFSCLTEVEARLTVTALQKYESGYVCNNLERYRCHEAIKCISRMLESCYKRCTIGGVVATIHPWLCDEGGYPYFDYDAPSGIAFRKAWVKHLISDIMREHELVAID